jgi:glutaconate CoA-transferase subunit B
MNCSVDELMAVVFARRLKDGDVVVTGTNAAIPLLACEVARRASGKRITSLIGATGTIDPSCADVPKSGADERFIPGRFTLGLATGVHDQLRGRVDVIFLGGLQVDLRGRCNLTAVGPYAKPTLRGPGSIGLSMMATVPRTFLIFGRHDPRIFVEEVDFVSAQGLAPNGGGLAVVVTPLCVMAPDPARSRLVLESIHPGVSFAQVQQSTGFRLDPACAGTTAPPTEEELAALRCAAVRNVS